MGIRSKIALCLALFLPLAAGAKEERINVKEVVLEHLGDSYGWHLWGDVSVPLPVILYDGGVWNTFSSSRVEHGGEHKGFLVAQEGKHKGKIVNGTTGERPSLDISVTKNAAAIIMISVVLLIIVMPLARWYSGGRMTPPRGFTGAIEVVIEYVREEVIRPCLGEDTQKFSPYLLTIFFFILTGNLLGLIPFFPAGANVTGNIAVTFLLALTVMLVVNISGNRHYWKEVLWPDVPLWLKVPVPIMPFIEIIGVFTKPFALMIRLFANIFAGHAVLTGLVCVIFITGSMGAAVSGGMTAVSVLFGVFMLMLELLVAFIQAYVFTMLSALFIGMARPKTENNH